MLGRLLRTGSFMDLLGPVQNGKEDEKWVVHQAELSPPPAVHMPDELKSLLLGCKKIDDGKKAGENSCFRLVIAQELGRMLSRDNYQVILDYVCTRNAATGQPCSNGGNMENIPLSELKEYIFGSPVRVSDRCQSDKLKLIQSARLIVVTRIFYNKYSSVACNSNQRIAICCCMPESFLTVLTECWSQVTRWFDDCQGVLAPLLEADPLLPKELNAKSHSQVEAILNKFYCNLISPLQSLLEVQRLMLYPHNFMDFTTSWYREVFNWLEVKDGHRLKFLPVLLAKLKYDSGEDLLKSKSSRIIITSGNVTVANKLIFVISAFLKPRYEGEIHIIPNGTVTPSAETTPTPTGAKYDSTITSKGWEIPRKQSTSSVLSKSSDEASFAHVFLPSSLRSTSSLQYISSSLNSQYGSYGSWFKKAMPLGQSPRTGESPDQAFMNNRNNSTPSLHQQLLTTSSSTTSYLTAASTTPNTNRWSQGSPSINEYEEYPWPGCATAPSVMNAKSRIQKVHMQRSNNRVHDEKLLRKKFDSISGSQSTIDFHVSAASEHHDPVLEVPITEDLSFPSQELLPPYTSYMHNFEPMFQVQACPISSITERRLMECMKNDLQHFDYSRILIVSLRSREIKEITLTKDPNTRSMIKRTSKIFQNGKQGNISQKFTETVQFIDQHLSSVLSKWEDPAHTDDKIKMLHESFQVLMK
ncbi:HDL387Cp [Eremothecium sinecaudum]|uniref:Protein LST4 n=1 Tax=Eremothecium sinecaudum TaxID=45286 RepID=A0A109UYU3_9SACH|nr:HDL387Cp [Eremothecium sinecaudum]AMD20357.1 HDL387Cp [Eremothecium sinecaudum]